MKNKLKIYDYKSYWAQNRHLQSFKKDKKVKIKSILSNLKDVKSIIEFGSGQGELTKLLLEVFPEAKITCVDINRWYLKHLPEGVELVNKDILEYETKEKYDLVISSHLLLHIEPEYLESVWEKMESLSKKHLIHIDPIKENIHREWEVYNFPHDYNKLHPEAKFYQVEKYSGLWQK